MKRLFLATAVAALVSAGPVQAGVTFNFTFTPSTSAQAQAAFIQAGNLWSSVLADNVTLNFVVGTGSLPFTSPTFVETPMGYYSYAQVRAALAADATSADDAIAVANLQPGDAFDRFIAGTADNPNGPGSAVPYVDGNNSIVRLTDANAKALGLTPVSGGANCRDDCDALIMFADWLPLDFDMSDGLDLGAIDAVGAFAIEIGAALGFTSGVGVLYENSPPMRGPFPAAEFSFVTALDLFRYSAGSAALGAIDWTADDRPKYFSLDGGATVGAPFSLLEYGRWADGSGIMRPWGMGAAALPISAADKRAFDAIGWDIRTAQGPVQGVPEPATWATLIAGFGLAGAALRRRRVVPARRS